VRVRNANSRGADTVVTVNELAYKFYFVQTPEDTARLDRDACLEVHRGATINRFDGLQGG